MSTGFTAMRDFRTHKNRKFLSSLFKGPRGMIHCSAPVLFVMFLTHLYFT